jgi:3-hydroxybutyryl-CoA dehydrogenase
MIEEREEKMEIKHVMVVGFGTMGHGISQTSIQSGYTVTGMDIDERAIDRGLKSIDRSVGKAIEKGVLKEKKEEILGRLKTTKDLSLAKEADLVIEAVFEDIKVKKEVFRDLDRLCPPHTIITSNTSAISISEIASATKRPDRVVGTHFFFPVPVMRLVEVIKGVSTSNETMESTRKFATSIGKVPITVNMDLAGFLANRMWLLLAMEAIRLFEQGAGTAKDIDQSLILGYNHPMGPLEIADMSGLDVLCGAVTAIYNDTARPEYAPPMILRRMVAAGLHGRKTGKGFYEYTEEGKKK